MSVCVCVEYDNVKSITKELENRTNEMALRVRRETTKTREEENGGGGK